MDDFALTEDEWDMVQWAAGAVTTAAQANDPERRAARFADLRAILSELRGRKGNHPILWETEADFTLEPRPAADLYVRAERAAVERRLPTLTIRLSLARLLIDEMGRPAAGRATLLACADELPQASEAQCAAWSALLAACTPDSPAVPTEQPGPPPSEPAAGA
jgi:hypothetical protein